MTAAQPILTGHQSTCCWSSVRPVQVQTNEGLMEANAEFVSFVMDVEIERFSCLKAQALV